MIVSALSLLTWGLRYGLDFTGGTLMTIKFQKELPDKKEISRVLEEVKGIANLTVQPTRNNSVNLRFVAESDETNNEVINRLREKYQNSQIDLPNFIGPAISQELKRKAIIALILTILGITLYIAYAFRKVSRPVESWKYGLGAIIALTHDVLITVGAFSILGHFGYVEVDMSFIAALLTILGFSVHDTIVVYDRIRENLLKVAKEEFDTIVNQSLNETMSRSINTSLTVLITLAAILLFGGDSIKPFSLALIIGIFFGTYSSIFIASSLLVDWWHWKKGEYAQ